MRGRRFDAVIALGAVGVVLLAHVVALWTAQEDAFISFRYAKNFAAGHGLVWNIDEPPVEGYTNFLWVVVLAAVHRVGLDLVFAAQVLGTVCAVATLVLVAWLGRRLYGASSGVWLIPPSLLAVSGSFAAWASSGMETSLFTFLLVLAVACEIAEHDEPGRRPLSSMVLALAAMTRPEGALVFVLVLLHRVADPPARRRDLAALTRWTLGFALPFGVYFAWRYDYYGFLLPNTFYAKVGTTAEQVVRGLKYVGKFFIVMGVPIVAVTGFAIGRRTRLVRTAAIVTVPYLAYIALVGGDYMALFRFMVPVLPFMAVVTPLPLIALARRTRHPRAAWAATGTALIVLSLAPSLNVEGVPSDPPDSPPNRHAHQPARRYFEMRWATAYPRLIDERWYVHRLHLLGAWMQRELPAEAVVASGGVGVIGYLCDRPMIDMLGLNDIHIAHLRTAAMGSGMPGHEKRDLLYVLRREPTYILHADPFSATPRGPEQIHASYAREFSQLPPHLQPIAWQYLKRYAVQNVLLTDGDRPVSYVTFLRLTQCSTPDGCRSCPRCDRRPRLDVEGPALPPAPPSTGPRR